MFDFSKSKYRKQIRLICSLEEKGRYIRKFKKLFADEFNFKAILQYKIQIILLKVRIENCYNEFLKKEEFCLYFRI